MAKPLEHRQGEACRFARTRLGSRHHIVTSKYGRNALALDWGRLGVALFGYSLKNRLPQPKGGEIKSSLRNRINNQDPSTLGAVEIPGLGTGG
jgi:hypothetical protein